MSRRFAGVWFAAALSVAAIAAPGVSAAKPTFERITVDETLADEFLTEECGVPITSHVDGHIAIRTFEGNGTGPLEVHTISVSVTATAGDFVFVTIHPDAAFARC